MRRAYTGAANLAVPRLEPGDRYRDLVWCTASAGWSKWARKHVRGAVAVRRACAARCGSLRSRPAALLEAEGVDVLCMAPTEYRMIAKRAELRPLPALRSAVAAGEALEAQTRTGSSASGDAQTM
jgi:acyl-coenzyme A synthetase/AMP-(fatty) acid ligase